MKKTMSTYERWTYNFYFFYMDKCTYLKQFWGRRGRGRMVVGLTTTCAISAYYN